MDASEKTIERLCLYRRLLVKGAFSGAKNVFSHDISKELGISAAQVRRDLMTIGFAGSSKTGYDVDGLVAKIGAVLDTPGGEPFVLFGVGDLGRAILHFFSAHQPKLRITAAFDIDPEKANRVLHGCRCHLPEALEETLRATGVRLAIVAVPAEAAQAVADRLVAAGIRGIVNFTPVVLRVPPEIMVETVDIAVAMEKIVCMTRLREPIQEEVAS